MKLHGEGARLRKLWRPWVTKRYLESHPVRRLHIGCGWNHVDGWLNVDKFAANADTYLNAYKPFPFPSNTFDKAFTEHMIEHLEVEKVRQFLQEVFRVLKPGGVFRVTCPDLELYANKYVQGDDEFFGKVAQCVEGKRMKNPDLAWMVRGNGGAFMTGVVKNFHKHKWMYDFNNLSACLSDVGFENITKQKYGTSIDKELASMDHSEHAYETLYIDAVKPK
jgi:predicted SAM-dependent methyltransferase